VRIGVSIYALPDLNFAAYGNALKRHISYYVNEIITVLVLFKKAYFILLKVVINKKTSPQPTFRSRRRRRGECFFIIFYIPTVFSRLI
jgi:hypothetical protein